MMSDRDTTSGDSFDHFQEVVDSSEDLVCFGELKSVASKATAMNPERLKSQSVQAVRLPSIKESLPTATRVFMDVDVMLEIQEHATEDTTVELGGLLLGQRGKDDDGTPIVVVSDSLRARHYRATRGSFTFTHETWSDLQRQRSQLDQTLEIVGWYHTHPGWGVFLSELDCFICDHFFSHPDDIALVVDPLKCETGLFVRRGSKKVGAPGRLPQYWLFGHRRRESDLVSWSQYFSGASAMPQTGSMFAGRQNPPIVIHSPVENRNSISVAHSVLFGIMILQTLLLIGMFAAVLTASGALAQRTSADTLSHRESAIDEILQRIANQGTDGIEKGYRELILEKAETDAANVGLLARIEGLEADVTEREREQTRAESELSKLRAEVEAATSVAAQEPQGFKTASRFFAPEHRTPFILGLLCGAFAASSIVGVSLWRRQLLGGGKQIEKLECP